PPGFVDTPMLRESPVDIDAFARTTPMKRPGRPEDIASAAAWLASEDGGYVTGQPISVHGGRFLTCEQPWHEPKPSAALGHRNRRHRDRLRRRWPVGRDHRPRSWRAGDRARTR